MVSRLTYGSTMKSSHIATLQIPGLSKQSRQIEILPKMKTARLISFGVLCDDGCTITLENQETPVQKNGQQIIKCTRNKKTGVWEVTLETKQSEIVENNMLAHTTKPELTQYFHVALFRPTTGSLLKAMKQDFLKT